MARHEQDKLSIEIADGESGLFSKSGWLDGWEGISSNLKEDESYEITWRGQGEDMGVSDEEILSPIVPPVVSDVSEEGE